MKKFKLTLIVPLIITLLVTGCMPDSLTKFKKDEVKKAKPASTTTGGTISAPPVIDDTGVPVEFIHPTFFSIGSPTNLPITATLGKNFTSKPFADGTLSDSAKIGLFFERCDIITTGVNAQSVSLPAGVALSTSNCSISGTPATSKSIVTEFCSDNVSVDQATCETNPLVWNGTSCSLPDLKYNSSAACTAAFHKWYSIGDPVPYLIRMNYHNASGVQSSIYTTVTLGAYKTLTSVNFTQSDKLLLKVSGVEPLTNIVPLATTTATTGAYAKGNIIISNTEVASVAKFVDTSLSYIGVSKLIPIKVLSTTPFVVNTFVTKSGDASKVGKIFKIDSANRILYVENISSSNSYFVAGEAICSNSITGVCGTSYPIQEISESYILQSNQKLDNDKQYFSSKYNLTTPINVFEVGTLIKPLSPIASLDTSNTNGVTYSISPALPCEDPTDPADCVTMDPATGIITGTFSSFLQNTEFTITALNPISSTTTKLNISAIVGPSELAVTTKQIITVSSTTSFKEGEELIQPITPPLTESLKAKIVKILNPYQMAIETFNGEFVPGVSLDNNNSTYQSEKAFIIPYLSCTDTNYTTQASCEAASNAWAPEEALHYNLSITINSSGAYEAGDIITSSVGAGAGAYGKVIHVFTGARDELFVQYLTQASTSTAAAPTFHEGDTLLNTGAVIYQIQNSNMKVTLASAVSFVKGSDVVSSTSAAGYTHNVSGSILSISDISKISSGTHFKIGQTLYNHETQSESTASSLITAVTHNSYLIFERGKAMYATASIGSGNGIIYSISPALPTGLSLDTSKGTIYGTATGSSLKKDYILTATNFIGSARFVVAIEVKDFFEVIQNTGASSALLHKVGDYQTNRKCRVDSTDITSMTNAKALDIRCFLDMEEQDLFQTDLKLKLFTGPGICQYIRYEPYYFYSWQPHKSLNTSMKYKTPTVVRNGCSNLQSSGEIPTPALCDGNYASVDNPTYPNCDDGKLIYFSETYAQNGTTGACTLSAVPEVKTVNCGGKRINCISGAIKDPIGSSSLDLGNRSLISPSSSGINYTYEHKAPLSKGDVLTNIRLANGTIANQCYSSAADTLDWKDTTALTSNRRSTPFASDSNPFYTVSCLDAAQDVKARIRIIVRDWDRAFNIESDIFNQSFLTPPANMNNSNPDPIFNSPYNDIDDLDDDYSGRGAAAFTAGSCGSPAAGGSCSAINGVFPTSVECAAVGGTTTVPGSCSNVAYTNYLDCVGAGTCSNGAYTNPGTCVRNGATWTPHTWTHATCTFDNQNQCEYYGGTWTGDEMYKFPNTATSNILGI